MLSRRTLRAMRDRWQKDLDRLEAAYVSASGPAMEEAGNSETETVRNLATAIAHIDGLITHWRPGDAGRAALSGDANAEREGDT